MRLQINSLRIVFCLTIALCSEVAIAEPADLASPTEPGLFDHENLVAWCIVPFDGKKRGPEERAAMLEELGLKHFAYDYRAKHIPTFDAEMEALKQHGVELTAWWFPKSLNEEAKLILEVLKRHDIQTQLWVTGTGKSQGAKKNRQQKIEAEVKRIRPIAEAAAEIGCQVALYNHGGWFGEPENQIAILKELDLPNVGLVYNLHHGHGHLDRFDELLQEMKPYLLALNLNGMTPGGEKILPIGAGDFDLRLLKSILDSGWQGPIGILNHTQQDAKMRLKDNLDGLDWLVAQLEGKNAGPAPKYKSYEPQKK